MTDYNELEKELRAMTKRSKFFAIVKAEMEARGHWKAKPRGIPMKKGKDNRRNLL